MIQGRDEFKDYIKSRLGAPNVFIAVSDEQFENCIDDAIQFYREFNIESITNGYFNYIVTDEDIKRRDTLRKTKFESKQTYDFSKTKYLSFKKGNTADLNEGDKIIVKGETSKEYEIEAKFSRHSIAIIRLSEGVPSSTNIVRKVTGSGSYGGDIELFEPRKMFVTNGNTIFEEKNNHIYDGSRLEIDNSIYVCERCMKFANLGYVAFLDTELPQKSTKIYIMNEHIGDMYIDVPNELVSVSQVLSLSAIRSIASQNLLSYDFNFLSSEIWALNNSAGNSGISQYVTMMQHMNSLDVIFGKKDVVFSHFKKGNRVYINWKWDRVKAGESIVLKVRRFHDPEEFQRVFNDRTLKNLATAYVKRQWANNLFMVGNISLYGDVKVDVDKLRDDALVDIELNEKEIREMYAPALPAFLM